MAGNGFSGAVGPDSGLLCYAVIARRIQNSDAILFFPSPFTSA